MMTIKKWKCHSELAALIRHLEPNEVDLPEDIVSTLVDFDYEEETGESLYDGDIVTLIWRDDGEETAEEEEGEEMAPKETNY